MDILPILVPLEKALNTVIQGDDSAKRQLFELEGKSLFVKVLGLEAEVYIVFSQDKIYFQQSLLTPATAEMSAYPFSLLRLMLSKQVTPKQLEDITIHGDVMFAQQAKNFFTSLKIDWQYYLAPLLGDVVIEATDKIIRRTKDGLQSLLSQFNTGAVNYLQNEINYLPHPNAMEGYIQEVNEFRDGVERLQARLNLLKKKFTPS